MSELKIGLIGYGVWARTAYRPVLDEADDVRIVAVAAPSEATREQAAHDIDDVTTFDDYHKLLADPTVDAVMISLPGALHADAVTAAVGSGKHVFFEPPIGCDEQEIERALSAINSAQQIVQADLELRYLPVIEAVRQRLDREAIGQVRMAQVRLWCDWGAQGQFANEAQREGFFLWLGCWYLDVLDVVFGEAPASAQVAGGRARNGALFDHGWATLTYPSGAVGQFEVNLLVPADRDIRLRVAGDSGEIDVDLYTGRGRWRGGDGVWHLIEAPASEPTCGFPGMRESILDFLAAIREGRPPRADLNVIRRVHEAALRCSVSI
jgi:predicted dehydrogenase